MSTDYDWKVYCINFKKDCQTTIVKRRVSKSEADAFRDKMNRKVSERDVDMIFYTGK